MLNIIKIMTNFQIIKAIIMWQRKGKDDKYCDGDNNFCSMNSLSQEEPKQIFRGM